LDLEFLVELRLDSRELTAFELGNLDRLPSFGGADESDDISFGAARSPNACAKNSGHFPCGSTSMTLVLAMLAGDIAALTIWCCEYFSRRNLGTSSKSDRAYLAAARLRHIAGTAW
jgi:hypothetical protein